eukprot:6664824-Ditylum_brightwellii.AAC.1
MANDNMGILSKDLLFGVIGLKDSAGYIIVTENDNLYGQGWLTNHHRKNTGPRHCEPSPTRLHTIYKGAEAFCINPIIIGQSNGLDTFYLLLPITKEQLSINEKGIWQQWCPAWIRSQALNMDLDLSPC